MSFDGNRFVQHLAKRLIQDFEFASGAGTPGLVGTARENPARNLLSNMMPDGIAVGSGIVADSYGAVSKQQDIVIYETLCPIFTHSGAAEATYFPVEGVVAIGEVKSTLTSAELKDCFEKARSVKLLIRHAVPSKDAFLPDETVSFRNYASRIATNGVKEEEFDQHKKSICQVYYFVLCKKFGTSAKTMVQNATRELNDVGRDNAPNFIVSLDDGFISPYSTQSNSLVRAASDGDGLIYCDQASDGFSQLLSILRLYARNGKTVDLSVYDRYFWPPEISRTFNIKEFDHY